MKKIILVLACASVTTLGCANTETKSDTATDDEPAADESAAPPSNETKASMNIAYLEFVTPEVDAVCAALEKVHGVTFGEPVPELGNARTAELPNGGRLGVRAPMRDDEEPVVRPYFLVDDLAAAVKTAEAAGAEVAISSMEIPGQGTIAIYFVGGVEHGLLQR